MSKGSTKVDAPDPIEIARADARFNRIDQYTPFANFTYSGPDRNQATLQLNPFLAGNENRRMLSDRMMLDQALGRQQSMIDGGLPALTQGVDPGALNQFFGLPSSLQGGYDTYNNIPNVPDITGQEGTGGGSKGGSQGGGLPSAPPGGPVIPGQGGMKGNTIGAAQGLQQAATPGGGVYGQGGSPAPQPYRPGADMSIKPQAQPTAVNGQPPAGQKGAYAQGGGGVAKPQQGVGDIGGAKGGALASNNHPIEQAFNSPGQPPVGGTSGIINRIKNGQASGGGGAKGGQQPPAQQSQSNPLFGGTVGGLIDPNTFGQIGSLDQLQDFDLDRGRVEQALFDRQSTLLQPELDQQEQRTISDLRARGIPRGSEAWDREIEGMRKNRMLQYGNIANQAVLGGGGEQSRLFGISSALGDRTQNAQSQIFNMADLLAQRDIQTQLQNANMAQSNRATQFNELASLLGLQQVASPQLNNFFAPGQADVTGAYALNQQAQAGNAQRSADMKGGVMEGITSLGGAAMMSDRRLKENVKRIGSINGYPLYEFDYVWGEHSIGVMSDEVPEDFVIKHPSGYDMVDYSKVLQWQA